MKRLLLIIAATMIAGSAYAQPPAFDPHHGLTHLFETKWNHKGAKRLDPPHSIRATLETIQYTLAIPPGGNRAVLSHLVPYAAEPVRPGEPYTVGLMEDWQIERFQSPRGPIYIQAMSSQIEQLRIHHPEVRDKDGKLISSETYTIWLHNDQEKKNLHFAKNIGNFNYVSFAGEQIKVYANRQIDLGEISFVSKPAGYIAIRSSEFVKEEDGVKFLKVAYGGKKYGVRLEALDW